MLTTPRPAATGGLPGAASQILGAARVKHGDAPPAAIVLTHGHFDHVGVVRELADHWGVPVYAHELELPYLTGRSDYPPPDPVVGGGLVARLSPLMPWHGIDLGNRVRPLPADGSVPGLAGWQWVATPGHSPGHVSFFRDADRALIAGDAFVTVRQEALTSILAQVPQIHRPPAYFTCDWAAAGRSVAELARLRPAVAVTGHGPPVAGDFLQRGLDDLAAHFPREVPRQGRYVWRPAVADADGVRSLPPPADDPAVPWLVGLGVAAGVALLAAGTRGRA